MRESKWFSLGMSILIAIWLLLFGQTTNTQITTHYEDVESAICRTFDSECETALRVFRGESGLRPDAEGDNGKSIGVAQINEAHFKRIPGDTREEKVAWLKNFQNNLAYAKFVRNTSGWTAWTIYRNMIK